MVESSAVPFYPGGPGPLGPPALRAALPGDRFVMKPARPDRPTGPAPLSYTSRAQNRDADCRLRPRPPPLPAAPRPPGTRESVSLSPKPASASRAPGTECEESRARPPPRRRRNPRISHEPQRGNFTTKRTLSAIKVPKPSLHQWQHTNRTYVNKNVDKFS